MTLVKQFILFFESIFKSSDPEVQRKIKIKNIEDQLKESSSNLYKSHQLQPTFGQALFILYQHTQLLHKLLSKLSDSSDTSTKEKVYLTLIQTGYNDGDFSQSNLLDYAEKKKRMQNAKNISVETEYQRKNLENHLKVLTTAPFHKIQVTLNNFDIFLNVCNFNFINCIHLFDSSYNITSQTQPNFSPTDVEEAETVLQDLYYVIKNLSIDASLARALIASIAILNNGHLDKKTKNNIITHIKTISEIFNQILTVDCIKNLVRISKNDPTYEPEAMISQNDYISKYRDKLKRIFKDESRRISSELQDEKLNVSIKKLFGDQVFFHLNGYNQKMNLYLQERTTTTFLWVTPLEIIKNFLIIYLPESVFSLLNDIVLEGFFLNPTNKSIFSSLIYSCNVFPEKLKSFEDSFDSKGEYSTELIQGYVQDSQRDSEFEKTLQTLIDKINLTAKDLVQTISQNLALLYKKMDNIFADSKKTTPEEIENIKVLFQSSRNHENADFLEKSMPKWQMFIDIMKNYAIINNELKDINE
ncbi:MAG: hypothetical protein BKP49_07110 [Treponema sp. CETP13]|nr:MAG: hypothetical protein BKP49_07110 [Treponema sp. CETP13]